MRKLIIYIALMMVSTVAISQVKVVAPITTNDPADTYPTHYDSLGSGGYMTMQNLTSRDAIPAQRRKQGMLVYVKSNDSVYQLQPDLATWRGFKLGSANPAGASTGTDSAIIVKGPLTKSTLGNKVTLGVDTTSPSGLITRASLLNKVIDTTAGGPLYDLIGDGNLMVVENGIGTQIKHNITLRPDTSGANGLASKKWVDEHNFGSGSGSSITDNIQIGNGRKYLDYIFPHSLDGVLGGGKPTFLYGRSDSSGVMVPVEYYGLYIPRGPLAAYGTEMVFRDNTMYIRSMESNVIRPWLQIADRNYVESTYPSFNEFNNITASGAITVSGTGKVLGTTDIHLDPGYIAIVKPHDSVEWGGSGVVDTMSLSDRINDKLSISDTANNWMPKNTHIPVDQVNSDWDAASGIREILHKPIIPEAPNLISGSNVTITGTYPNLTISAAGSSGGEANVQSDWNESSSSSDAFIKNKPIIPTSNNQLTNEKGYVTTDTKYTAGSNVSISGSNVISATGGGGVTSSQVSSQIHDSLDANGFIKLNPSSQQTGGMNISGNATFGKVFVTAAQVSGSTSLDGPTTTSGKLYIAGTLQYHLKVTSVDYTIQANDVIIEVESAVTITLPSANHVTGGASRILYIKNNGSGSVTLTGDQEDLLPNSIPAGTTLVLYENGGGWGKL